MPIDEPFRDRFGGHPGRRYVRRRLRLRWFLRVRLPHASEVRE